MKDVGIEKVWVSKKICSGTLLVTFMMIITLSNLHIVHSKASAYNGKAKWVYFVIEDDCLLKK